MCGDGCIIACRAIRNLTLLLVAALVCGGSIGALGAEEAHAQPSITFEGAESVAILLSARDGSSYSARTLSAWSGYLYASGDALPLVWVPCFRNTPTEALVGDLPRLLPFVVEHDSSWAAILKSFQLRVRFPLL